MNVEFINSGAKRCTDICPRTLFVPRSEQFSESEAKLAVFGTLCPDKSPCIFLKPNGGYCVYYPSNIFTQVRSFLWEARWPNG